MVIVVTRKRGRENARLEGKMKSLNVRRNKASKQPRALRQESCPEGRGRLQRERGCSCCNSAAPRAARARPLEPRPRGRTSRELAAKMIPLPRARSQAGPLAGPAFAIHTLGLALRPSEPRSRKHLPNEAEVPFSRCHISTPVTLENHTL